MKTEIGHCTTIRSGVAACAFFFLCLASATWAGPLRLAIPPAPYRDMTLFDEATCVAVGISLYLQESFDGSPSVWLVSESRGAAIRYDLIGGARDVEESRRRSAYSERVPVDAWLDYRLSNGRVSCTLYTAAGIRRREIPVPPKVELLPLAEAVADFLVTELKLDAETAAALTARREEKREFFAEYFITQRQMHHYFNNCGKQRLINLHPYLAKHAGNPYFAAQVLNSAYYATQNPVLDLEEFVKLGPTMAWVVLPTVLGTPWEESAHRVLRARPARFEKSLLGMVKVLTGGEMERALDDTPPAASGGRANEGSVEKGAGPQPGAGYSSPTVAQRLGALRCLGVIQSQQALAVLKLCAANEDAQTREAAAVALRYYEKETGLDMLMALAGDKDPTVAFAASYSLWKRGKEPARLLTLARGLTADKARRAMALESLASLGTKEDVPALSVVAQDPAPAIRTFAAQGLLRLEAADARQILAFLDDPYETVVLGALSAWHGTADAGVLARLETLANDPFVAAARAARLTLAGQRPAQGRDRDLFDLKVEHNYIRMQIVDGLATNREPWSLDALEQACGNQDAHTRAHALGKLLARDPARDRPALARALADTHRWVRLHAAALLSGVAGAAEVEAIRKAAAVEKDEVIGLYLADALAKAEGKPLPPARPSVHPIAGKKNLTWQVTWGADVENSPAEAYYLCGMGAPVLPEAAQRAYRAGKIFIPRVNTVGNTCDLISNPEWQDKFWLVIQEKLTTNNLPWFDGVIYGEESLSANADEMWKDGWPLFCHDANLDPGKIKGDRKNLSLYEARAWTHWSQTKLVEGFNILYDYTKLYYGKLRPGFQVGTYLPTQGAVTPADKQWKFDFGGYYCYEGSSRAIYTYSRRLKTLWPDRPISWQANGCTHLYGNLNAGAGPNHASAYPAEIMVERWERPYADNVSAWMAGADSGWFGFFGAGKEGRHEEQIFSLHVEDIYPGNPSLENGMTRWAAYVETLYRAEVTNIPSVANMTLSIKDGDDPLELDLKKPEDHPAIKRAREFRARMLQAHLIMGKYVNDCTRVFASLPRLDPKPQALVIHPSGWPYTAPGLRLLNAYDYLPDINQAATDLDLSHYRIIAVSGMNDAPLMDATIERVTIWLKEQPGVLYVHGTLSAANTNEASTAAHHDGMLKNDWPWEKDVSLVVSNYTVAGPHAKTLVAGPTGPVRVLWQGPDFKGAVIFDTGTADAGDLRKTMNAIYADKKIGLALNGPASQEVWQEQGLSMANSFASNETNFVKGVDLLTGEANPQVGPGRNSAIVVRDYTGKYIASWNGVAILCDQPITSATAVENGLRVECPGLIRAGSETGAAAVRPEGGGELPTFSGVTNVTTWVLSGKEDGQGILPIGKTDSTALYVRCKQPVVITRKHPTSDR